MNTIRLAWLKKFRARIVRGIRRRFLTCENRHVRCGRVRNGVVGFDQDQGVRPSNRSAGCPRQSSSDSTVVPRRELQLLQSRPEKRLSTIKERPLNTSDWHGTKLLNQADVFLDALLTNTGSHVHAGKSEISGYRDFLVLTFLGLGFAGQPWGPFRKPGLSCVW